MPSTLSPEQTDDATAALEAYVGYSQFLDRAYANPSGDYSIEVKQWAAGPVADSFLRNIAGTADLGQYTTGEIALSPKVTDVQPALVTISDCPDSTQLGFFNRDGVSIKAPDAPGSYFRHPSQIQVGEFEGGKWLVQSVTDDYSVTC